MNQTGPLELQHPQAQAQPQPIMLLQPPATTSSEMDSNSQYETAGKKVGLIMYNPISRDGAVEEADKLHSGLEAVSCEVIRGEWSTIAQLIKLMDEGIKSAEDCCLLMVCIMSHGRAGLLCCEGGDDFIAINYILLRLKLELPANIPLVVLIQSCQQSQGVLGNPDYPDDCDALAVAQSRGGDSHIVLDRTHTLLLLATMRDGFAKRGTYTDAIAQQFKQANGKSDILDIHTKAVRKMEELNERTNYQTPELRTTLKMRLILSVPQLMFVKKLGDGAYGIVHLYRNPETSELLAVKQLRQGSRDQSQVDSLHHEIKVLSQMEHQRVVRYIRMNDDPLSIIMEFVPGGSLEDKLKIGPLNEADTRHYTNQILEGLTYLHQKNIIHRDLKAANVLYTENDEIKLADFGVSKLLKNCTMVNSRIPQKEGVAGSALANTCIGSVYWMAPEVVRQDLYGRRADIWSLACTVVEMLTCKHPWSRFEQAAAIFKIGNYAGNLDPLLPDDHSISKEALAFLKRLFVSYEERPYAWGLKDDLWLKPTSTPAGGGASKP